MKGASFSLILLFPLVSLQAQTSTDIKFTEVMFNPPAADCEFIEIYNSSSTMSINLSGFKIKYQSSSYDTIIEAKKNLMLPPKSYAVIFEGNYDISSGIYNNIIPESALVLKISDNAFGSTGMSNTSNRTLYLLNAENDTLDLYTYSANNPAGISDEKIFIDKDNSPGNWANSIKKFGTPGMINSVVSNKKVLSINSFMISPLHPVEGEDILISFIVKNNDISAVSSCIVEIFNDANFDTLGAAQESIYSQKFSEIAPEDSIIINKRISKVNLGNYQIIASVSGTIGSNTVSDHLIRCFTASQAPAKFNDIIINEIMYAPLRGEPEWIELFNQSFLPVNLKKWKVSDNSTSQLLSQKNKLLNPGEYLILCRDSSIKNFYTVPSEIIYMNLPSLNNSGDVIVLADSMGRTIDSLSYLPSWGGNLGRSLERVFPGSQSISSGNWKTSRSKLKATPGLVNSVTPKDYDLSVQAIRIPSAYFFIGSPAVISVTVRNSGLRASGAFSLELYKDINCDSIAQSQELKSLNEYTGLSPADSITYNFIFNDVSEGKNYLIIKLSADKDDDISNNISYTEIKGIKINEQRQDIVINEIMYAPLRGEPEWIELYNKSSKQINILGYKLANHLDTSIVIHRPFVLKPDEYCLITKDSTIFLHYDISSKYSVAQFPSLNNSDDKIILMDSLNRVIDSVKYSASWGGNNGFSLERNNVQLSSNDPFNWKTCISSSKATPGYLNSISKKKYDIKILDLAFAPPWPGLNDHVFLSAKVINSGQMQNQFRILLFEDTDLDSLSDKPLEVSDIINLSSNDSLIYTFRFSISSLRSQRAFAVKIEPYLDEDSTNNYSYKIIEPGYPPNSVVINEIMYAPSNGEPEWIELFNTTKDSVSLRNWQLADILAVPSLAKLSSDRAVILPLGFTVLVKDSSIYPYHRNMSCDIIKTDLPVLNNDEDGIVLKDSRGSTIDSVRYYRNMGGQNGFSLERKSAETPSTDQLNWNSSKDISKSTPGQINSISAKNLDLSLSEISFSPHSPVQGDSIFVNIKVLNEGKKDIPDFSLVLFYKSYQSTRFTLLTKFPMLSLKSSETLLLSSPYPLCLTTDLLLAAKIIFPGDEDSTNNYLELKVSPGYSRNSIVINELMYDPKGNEPEWFELLNTSDKEVNLDNWSFSTVSNLLVKNKISLNDLTIPPGRFIVIAKDSLPPEFYTDISLTVNVINFKSLGDLSDGLVLYDSWDNTIDSLKYKSAWGGRNGRSLERFSLISSTCDSTNWASSINNAFSTPGQENSITDLSSYTRESVVINEIMFDPSSNNCEFIELFNNGNIPVNLADWQIFNKNGNYHLISDKDMMLPNGEYCVLAADSMIFQNYSWLQDSKYCRISGKPGLELLNTEDRITVKDAFGNVIDSVYYFNNWHNKTIAETKNKSLERINPLINSNYRSNWSSSLSQEGATPGKLNSIYILNQKADKKFSVLPNPFSPDNDGFEDYTIINYNFDHNVSDVRVKIFDSRGRLVRTLLSQIPGPHGSIIFDGLDEQGSPLRIGIYIILLEELGTKYITLETIKSVVVVARKL